MNNTIQFIGTTPNELVELFRVTLGESIKQYYILTNPAPQEKEVMTRKEVATLFGISLVCVHDWINKGILTPYKLGNKTYFKRSEIMETLYSSNKNLTV
jgi:excisionase family DNA binding protein